MWCAQSLKEFRTNCLTLANVVSTTSECEHMQYLSMCAGFGRNINIGDSFATLDREDPVTGLGNPAVSEYDDFLGSGKGSTMGALPGNWTVGPVKEIGIYGLHLGSLGYACAQRVLVNHLATRSLWNLGPQFPYTTGLLYAFCHNLRQPPSLLEKTLNQNLKKNMIMDCLAPFRF